MDDAVFEACVARAGLAPTVHNTQPARWRRTGNDVLLLCDTDVGLRVGDPAGQDAALSCGAVLEAMVLALSACGYGASVELTGHDTAPGQGTVPMAFVTIVEGAAPDGLHGQLEHRFTWRGAFDEEPPNLFGWGRADTKLVLDAPGRSFLADRNDAASMNIMQNAAFRRELVSWMRLSDSHPRAGHDGMDRAAMRMSKGESLAAPIVLTKLWGLLRVLGLTRGLVREYDVTLTAPLIALFHRPSGEDAVTSGRAYLRLCLEAASLGLAGWPMAALSDHAGTNAEVCARFGIGAERRFVQAVRFGTPTGEAPARARRPLGEVIR